MKPIQQLFALFAALALSQAGCSSGSSGGGTGGSGTASGSESGSGGMSSSSQSASGGSSSGGVASSGGASSSSVASASGGRSDGSTPGSGGAATSAGRTSTGTTSSPGGTTGGRTTTGGTGTGTGTTGTGGRVDSGGRTGTGTTGGSTGTAGATASGGAAGGSTSTTPSTDADPSPGCSATPTTTSPCPGTASSGCKIDVKGTSREYFLNLPTGYDGKKPAPVVWQYHPWGGTGKGGMTMYNLNSRLTNVIFISPHGTGSPIGFPNTNGMDEDMTRAVNAEVEAKFCTDKSRYFATGFSYGGSMSFTAACNMSDIFRGIGAQAGSIVSGATCAKKTPARMVAIWATHGDADTTLPMSNTTPMMDALVKNNGCTTTTKPVDPSPCVEYQGCKEGYPVIWCVRPGDGHAMASFAPDAITKFFKQFF